MDTTPWSFFMQSKGKLMSLVVLVLFIAPAIARERRFENFNAQLGPDFLRKGFALEDAGSYSDLSSLRLEVSDQHLAIKGKGVHSVVVRDGKSVGWIGQSLTYQAQGIGGVITVECDAEATMFSSGGGGFQLTLLIEFTPDDRVMFSLVDTGSSIRQFEITVDENNKLRFTPKVLDIQDGQPFHMQLELNTDSRSIKGWVDNQLWQADEFQGTISSNARMGIAATVRAAGDTLESLFDDISLSFDRRFIRGDANSDGAIDITDAITILSYLFENTAEIKCLASADTDDNEKIEITDPINLLTSLFSTHTPIPAPSPLCGVDEDSDTLPCAQSSCKG